MVMRQFIEGVPEPVLRRGERVSLAPYFYQTDGHRPTPDFA
jgi:hypothetical protein